MNLPKSIKILGVPISEIDMDLAISTIGNWIKLPDKRIICVRDVHGIILCQKDSLFMEIHNKADMVFADGMPIYWSAKLFGSKNIKRVTGPDFMTRMLAVYIFKEEPSNELLQNLKKAGCEIIYLPNNPYIDIA
jgi:UDP-N-acetyl-D-mannosaminuronic acid transferase (WecB/TagA/CpsF family)